MDQNYNFGLTPDQLSAPPTAPAAPLNGPAGAGASPLSSLLPSSSAKYEEKDGKHKGAAGTARDILGFLGDFLLTRLHMKPMYSDSQERRKLSLAEEGLGTTPQGTADAISRVNSIDPVMAVKLRDQYIDNQRQATNAASVQEARDARIATLKEATNTRNRGYAASMIDSMAGKTPDEQAKLYPLLRQQALLAGNRQGTDLSADLPEAYDPVALEGFVSSNIPVGTLRKNRLTDKSIDNREADAVRSDGTRRSIADQSDSTRRYGIDTTAGTADKNRGSRESEGAKNRDVKVGNNVRNNQVKKEVAAMPARPRTVAPPTDPNKIIIQNGVKFRYNPQTKTYDPQ